MLVVDKHSFLNHILLSTNISVIGSPGEHFRKLIEQFFCVCTLFFTSISGTSVTLPGHNFSTQLSAYQFTFNLTPFTINIVFYSMQHYIT
nr:unnamed protein product [Callosobruchus analis]